MTSTKQMKKYSITMNFTKIYEAVKPYMLREYKPIPSMDENKKKVYISSLKITAKSAEDACFRSMKNLLTLLRDQSVPEPIIQDVKNIASVKKIEELDE